MQDFFHQQYQTLALIHQDTDPCPLCKARASAKAPDVKSLLRKSCWAKKKEGFFPRKLRVITHSIHVWYIYLHLVGF